MCWEQRFTASFCASKRAGFTFEVAAALAVRENPPRSDVEKEILADVIRFHRDAWFGERPALRGFSAEMLVGADLSRSAGHASEFSVLDAVQVAA